MWQRQRTPHCSLLLQSLEKLGVMHHSPPLSFLSRSLSISPIVSLFIHLSVALLSVLIRFLTIAQRLPFHLPGLSPYLRCDSFKGGISESTNGRDLIGKCYGGGGALYCLLWRLSGRSAYKAKSEKCKCSAWRWADAADKLHIMKGCQDRGESSPSVAHISTRTTSNLLLDITKSVIIFGLVYYSSFSFG